MKLNQKTQGILYILGAAFFFALMNLFVRLSGDVPTMQKCFFRNIVAAFGSFLLLKKSQIKIETAKLGGKNMIFLLLRSTAGLLGIICNFYAVDHLPISDASMLNKLSPFFAIIFSAFILKEVAGIKEWGILLVAFAGAMFVVKPSLTMDFLPGFIGMVGGACAGLAYTFVRKLGQRGVPGMIIVFFFSAFSSLVLLPNLILHYTPMSAWQWIALLLAGAAAMGGQMCITMAYTKAPAKEISVYDYAQIVFAAILGFFVLQQIPDRYSIFGYIIILAAAILKWKSAQK